MANPTRRIRLIAAILAALGVVGFLIIFVAPYLCFFLFPGIFFWIGRITIAAGNGTYNTRVFWSAGALWECLVIGAIVYAYSGTLLDDSLQFAGMIASPLLSLVLSLLVLFCLHRSSPIGNQISETVRQDLQRYSDLAASGEEDSVG